MVFEQDFCKTAHSVFSGSISEHGTKRAKVTGFEAAKAEFISLYLGGLLHGDDHHLYVKAERESEHGHGRNALFKISVIFEAEEQYVHSVTEDITIGIMIEAKNPGDRACVLMEHFNWQLRRGQMRSGWMSFDTLLNRDEYVDTFKGGIKIKVFDFRS